MIEKVKKVINSTFEEVNSSSLVLDLLDCYSKLYANGAQLGGCSLCLRDYYSQLKKNGIEMAEKYEEVQKRTCVPNWLGNKYIREAARHYNNENITDEEALMLLNIGALAEGDFKVMPKIEALTEEDAKPTKKASKTKSI